MRDIFDLDEFGVDSTDVMILLPMPLLLVEEFHPESICILLCPILRSLPFSAEK